MAKAPTVGIRHIGARWVRMALERLGYRLINHDAYMDDLAKTSHLRALFRALAIDTVIDIGANRGQFIQFLRRDIGFGGEILAYEPNPDCQPALDSLKARDRNLQAHAVAIADYEGSVDLRIAESDDLTSILPFAPALEKAFEGGKLSRIVKVPCLTILGKINEDRRIFVKSDTQGYDLTLLSGGGANLSRISLLQVETQLTELYLGSQSALSMLDFLHKNEFQVAGVYRASTAGYPYTAFDVDILAVNRVATARGNHQRAFTNAFCVFQGL